MTRIRITIEHAGETFTYDADRPDFDAVTHSLGGFIDQGVGVVKRAIGVDA